MVKRQVTAGNRHIAAKSVKNDFSHVRPKRHRHRYRKQ